MAQDNCEDNCERLFQYLKGILFDSQNQLPNIDDLDEPYRKLGKGLEFLQQAVEEMQVYSADLSKGNLSGDYPSRDNFLCTNLKNLHANLNHLTWQAKQVASGDYSQHVSYLGEFSDAFNTMIRQLKERETFLKEESVRAQSHAKVMVEYNELLQELTRKRNEWIIVVDAETRRPVYCNKHEGSNHISENLCRVCEHRLAFHVDIFNWQDSEKYKEWENEDYEGGGFYRITTFHIEWRGRNAHAHIIEDITEDKNASIKLTSKAYNDPGTGLYNRLFFEEYLNRIRLEEKVFSLCYLDMDGLKYVNDNFGHNEGDVYIKSFVDVIQQSFQECDMFARIGGDEFCLILVDEGKEIVEYKLAQVLEKYVEENKNPYSVSFSYGVVFIDEHNKGWSQKEILKMADVEMYQHKRMNKEKHG